jgi:hypothetical protein
MLTRVLFAVVLLFSLAPAASAEDAQVAALGLTDHAVTEEALAKGDALPRPHFNTPAVAYALIKNLAKGDTVEVALAKDGAPLMRNRREIEADGEAVLLQAGKTGVPAGGWPEGSYTAKIKVTRDGKTIVERESDAIPFD